MALWLVAASASLPPGLVKGDPGPAPVAATPVPASLSAIDLDRLEKQMQSPDPAQRLAAAQSIAGAASFGHDAYVTRLRRPVTASTEVLRALIHGIWAQYPNPDYPKGPGKDPPMWFVRPEPRWAPPPRVPGQPRPRRPSRHDPDAVDWLSALAKLDLRTEDLTRDLPDAETGEARADALMRVALMRAIAAAGISGQRDAVYPLFEFAFVRDGLFRDECGRMIRSMGSYAVPALIRIYNDRTRGNAKMRRYASYQMDRMDRLRPSKAIATAPDDLTRADIIHAYGEARALDAVEAVLGQLDAPSHRVRREARWTWMRYVDGPPPPPAPMRKRKLPGGREEEEEKEDYLNYRELATLALTRTLKEVFGQPPDPRLSARQMTDKLLAVYDGKREAEFSQLFDEALARERAGGLSDLKEAVDRFGWILANQPDHPRRAEMARSFRHLGEQMAREGVKRDDQALVSRALGLLRQAVALDPAMADASKIMAQVHFLDGQQARRQGGDGLYDFTLAVASDPEYPGAQQALSRAQRHTGKKHGLLAPLLSVLFLSLGLGYLLWRRLSRRAVDVGGGEEVT